METDFFVAAVVKLAMALETEGKVDFANLGHRNQYVDGHVVGKYH
jgi:hypothetical protein